MRLDHEFTVPAPIDEVWKAIIDPERVAPCMPGATLTAVEGDTFKGTVKVKLGPVSLLYKGSGEFLDKNEASRQITIKASGKDSRGAGTAAATVTVTLTAEGETTKGEVATDLNVTGKPAQFGRGMISEVGGKILDSFAGNLSAELGTDSAGAGSADAGSAGTAASAGAAGSTAAGSAGGSSGAAESAGRDTTPGAGTGPGLASGAAAASPPPQPEKPQLESVKPGGGQEAEAIDLFDYAGASVAKRAAPVIGGLVALIGVIAIIRMLCGKKQGGDTGGS
ncbi:MULTISPECIES: SRPBCC family protein [Prauserella salsuginis group]|uniref:SRPBCC family protein n=1 Tax=Prauserella salsuginis TaxID=387889 RepID=A0ABW6G4W6_9PSEU|nr:MULTISPECIES: SRPBCC family protein [Prauserella salsuginis group]MCR3718798.1 Carbon monoxide dehydrogenase subunit G [Prauserella flava]MCR3733368.1 Carbon monoxide dehydrogenase subunit G [Prauserella salsuginis]